MQRPKRMRLRGPAPRLPDELTHMTLRRKSPLNEWQQIGLRFLLMFALLGSIITVVTGTVSARMRGSRG